MSHFQDMHSITTSNKEANMAQCENKCPLSDIEVQKTNDLFTTANVECDDDRSTQHSEFLPNVYLRDGDSKFIIDLGLGVKIDTHWLSENGKPQLFQCGGSNCPACSTGHKKEAQILLPVYDITQQNIGLMQIPIKTGLKAKRGKQPTRSLFEEFSIASRGHNPREAVYRIIRDNNSYSVTYEGAPTPEDTREEVFYDFAEKYKSDKDFILNGFPLITEEHPALAAALRKRLRA